MTLEEIKIVKDKHVEHLMSLKNVVSVGIGRKKVGGERTEELAIIVGVTKKLPPRLLKKTDIIPEVLDGIKTDVIEVGKIRAL